MILVDASAWIDFLRGGACSTDRQTELPARLGSAGIGDLILTEVLQGCATEREFNAVRKTLETLTMVTLGGSDVAIAAARSFRKLRARGITVRKTIHAVIATRCILDGYELLHCDREFEPFQRYLGRRCVVS